jgi:hypothetical protein
MPLALRGNGALAHRVPMLGTAHAPHWQQSTIELAHVARACETGIVRFNMASDALVSK